MKKILLVDDEKDMLDIFGTVLSNSGYVVVKAYNGKDGILMAKNQKPDLIILDIKMPGMDGVAASDILRDDPVTRDIPVIYLSSLVKKEQLKDGFIEGSRIGDLHFLSKSCSFEQLLAEVKKEIGSPLGDAS
ncbi:MAG: response regulator [Candidatus Omnitrophica bacterium]|nr:response regulator [Candidatus Omnitrophota bacterium]